jgi:hypothetical protein
MKNLAKVSRLHETAMSFAEQALLSPDPRQAGKLFRSAFEEERKAAELLEGAYDYEPTRSVLYRSAATLARDCQDFSEAKRLIREGLTGNPPGNIVAELKELLQLVHSDEARGPAQPRRDVPDEA